MKTRKQKVIAVLLVLALCVTTGVVCYRFGNDNGYVDGWTTGKVTEHLYTKFMDDLIAGEHLQDEDIESQIVSSYILYSNKRPSAQQVKHLYNILVDYVFFGFTSDELGLSD